MSPDATKKQPTAVTNDPQDLEYQIRLRARMNCMRHAAERTATTAKTGSAQKRRSRARKFASPPDYAHIQTENNTRPGPAPGPLLLNGCGLSLE